MTAASLELASALAARLCHDLTGPTGGILSGLDLLDDPSCPIPPQEALSLVRDSARALSAQLAFARAAFGAGQGVVDPGELADLADGIFQQIRPTLQWVTDVPTLAAPAARVLLNLLQLSAAALASGGVVRASVRSEDDRVRLTLEATGERARLYPEVLAGLHGEPRQGMAGRWVQGAFVQAQVAAAGGQLEATSHDSGVTFTAVL